MSDRDSVSGGRHRTPETDNLSASYALNALSDEERTAFETRIDESPEIRTEVAEMTETALLLGRAVEPVTPSAGLRSSIMGLLDSTPQLPRLETVAQDARGDESTTPSWSPAEPAAPSGELRQPTPLARQRWFMRPVVLAVSAAAAVALVFGAVSLGTSGLGQRPAPVAASDPSMSQILAASDVQHTAADISTGGSATLYWSNKLSRSAVVLNGVPALPSDKTYQLWYINGSKIASAGTVTASSNGLTQVLQGDLKTGDVVGITVEPAGGSNQPTTKPIVTLQSA
ncbi:Anti-sigma-K factor RskA [Frondihabitans sp. 762G35]|uniref:anti-sigma factor n=1 Tax=Frondihabitans sp. 762G35 TaxID=1446794 RepID=UPI000D215197|nr:anti-sigma factor [Frondihabitans sp. 762G35]ARC55876.1 Anti-sigma-K factor RskA [Frondihabitans sp. 762G35]